MLHNKQQIFGFRFGGKNRLNGRDWFHAVIDRISFHSFEAGTLDHFDDLLLGHFYFAAGFDGVAVGELAAVGDGAVEVAQAEVEGGS